MGVAAQLEEGRLLAEYAARLEVRNRIEVATIGEGRDYDPSEFAAAAAEALAALAEQQEAIARRLTDERRAIGVVNPRLGEAADIHDYHYVDRRNLGRRRRVARRLAKDLRETAADPARVAELVERARQDAWRDVAGDLGRRLAVFAAPPNDPSEGRLDRIASLAAELDALVSSSDPP